MIPTRPIDRPILFLAYLSIPIQFFWIALKQYQMFIVFIPLFAILVLSISMVMIGEPHGFLHTVGSVTGLIDYRIRFGSSWIFDCSPRFGQPEWRGGGFTHVSDLSNAVQRCHAIHCREIVRATPGDPACEQG